MENTLLTHSSASDFPYRTEINLFKRLVERTSIFINLNGFNISPFSNESLQKLETLPLLEIKKYNSKLMDNLQLLEGALPNNTETSNAEIVRNIASLMKLCVGEDFINQITDNDIVEIYNPSGIQMFRNLKFYETTAYSLTDLLVFEWSYLYERPTKIYEKLAEYAHYCEHKAHKNEVISLKHLSTHLLKEIQATPINLLEVNFLNIAPLTSFNGVYAGLIVTCQARSLFSLSDKDISFI